MVHRAADSGPRGDDSASAEAIVLRCFGVAYLLVFLVETFTSRPYPGTARSRRRDLGRDYRVCRGDGEHSATEM